MIKNLKVGDKVRIYRKVNKFPDDFDTWVGPMNPTVGKEGIVVSTSLQQFIVRVQVGNTAWNYPPSSLALVKEV